MKPALPRWLAPIALLPALLAPGAAAAAAPLKYEKAAFDQAMRARGPVIVHFSAGWCPTCQVQKPVVQQLLQEPAFGSIKLFVADYDRERMLRNAYGVNQQSTFVVFAGGAEVTRSTGQTSREALRAVFAKALPRNEWLDSGGGAQSSTASPAPPSPRKPRP